MDVYGRQTADGGAELGVVVDGHYVALAKTDAGQFAGLVENAKQRGDKVPKASASKGGAKDKAKTDKAGEEG